MFTRVKTMTIRGIDGVPVYAEVDVSPGLPDFSLVGDLSSETKEARERVKTSLRNSGFDFKPMRTTINLAPADLHKEGTGFDLAIAVGLAAAYEEVDSKSYEDAVMLGELSLDGRVCPIAGVLPMVMAAKESGARRCFVSKENADEAAVVSGIDVIGVSTLSELIEILKGEKPPTLTSNSSDENTGRIYDVDFAEVNGQKSMRRAAEVAAAGMHNILLVGSPGAGKTMIARRLPTILPLLSEEESLEVTRIYSVGGMLDPVSPLMRARPFRSPHHSISTAALIGGGRVPKPGEVSLADRGVLFLDELPEFQKLALEALRQPMEDRFVSVARVNGRCIFPADFMLVAAMNPCRCGYYPDRARCRCSATDVKSYLQRISRPLLDRIDIMVSAPPIKYAELGSESINENSKTIRMRVSAAQAIQENRFEALPIHFNSQMSSKDIKIFCALSACDESFMADVYIKMGLSARGFHKILKVARTIADLDNSENIRRPHLTEALSYRNLDERFWG